MRSWRYGSEVVTFKCPRDLLAMLDNKARELGLTRSEVIRMALWWFINEVPVKPAFRVRKVIML